jgi:hypothetical protein
MCDYSLETVKTRPARVADKLVTRRFWSATGGFCAPEDVHLAVCLLPGTELSFVDGGTLQIASGVDLTCPFRKLHPDVLMM